MANRIPADIDLAFHTGEVRTVKGPLIISRRCVTDLTVTSGTICVRDFIFGEGISPLRKQVPLGRHPVVLSLILLPGENEERPVFATIEFSGERPAKWELARKQQRDFWWGWWKSHGFPVDSWHVAVMDKDAATLLGERWIAIQKDADPIGVEHSTNQGLWNEHRFDGAPANVVTFLVV